MFQIGEVEVKCLLSWKVAQFPGQLFVLFHLERVLLTSGMGDSSQIEVGRLIFSQVDGRALCKVDFIVDTQSKTFT